MIRFSSAVFIRKYSLVLIIKNVEQSLDLLLYCVLGNIVQCLLPKMWSSHQVCQEMQCNVCYQKCGLINRFDTVCVLESVVQCLLPKMRSSHQVCQEMQCNVCYQKCGLIIRFDTVCVLRSVVQCLLSKMRSNHQV